MSKIIPAVVDTGWLEAHLDDPDIRIIDATTQLRRAAGDGYYSLDSGRGAFERQHIAGAVYADLLQDFSDRQAKHSLTVAPSAQFEAEMGKLGVSNNSHVIVYDQFEAGQYPEYYPFWASRLWWQLRLEGHDRVSVLEGGLGKWKREGRRTETGAHRATAAIFNAHRRPELIALIDEVADATGSGQAVLINVLNEKTFTGEQKVYARAGRIPSSKNLFFGKVIDTGNGQYLPVNEARQLLEQIGALDTGKKPIVYCGSGIAATIVALQLARVGRDDAAIYDGSMTEWAADPARPLVIGRD